MIFKKNCPLFFLGWGAFSLENIRKYLKIQEDNRKSATSASNGKYVYSSGNYLN